MSGFNWAQVAAATTISGGKTVCKGRISSSARWRHRLLTQVKAPPPLPCFDVDCHGDNRNPPLTSPPVAHSAAPSRRPKYGHVFRARCRAVGWKRWGGGRRGGWGREVVEIQESPRQRVQDTKGTKDGFNHRRNVFPDDIM